MGINKWSFQSKYDIGEGWAGTRLSKGGSNIEQLNSLNSYNNGPDGLEINLMSANSSTVNFDGKNHNTKLFVNNNLIIDTNYAYYQVLHINYEIQVQLFHLLLILNTKFLILVRI